MNENNINMIKKEMEMKTKKRNKSNEDTETTWEVPRFTLIEINNSHGFGLETNIRNLAS